MSLTISGPSTQIPVEVVEVGNEITQNQLNAITAGSLPATGNPFITDGALTAKGYATLASPTFTGTVTIPAGASISGYLTSATASSTYAPKASPTFTGTVTIPAGASISGYATSSSLSSYAPLASPTFSGTPSLPTGTVGVTQVTGENSTKIATTAFVKNQSYVTSSALAGLNYLNATTAATTYQPISGMSSYLTDAPSDGSEYVRKNAAWAVVTGGGGLADVPSATGLLYARRSDSGLGNVWEAFTVPTLSVTNIDLTGNFNGYSMGSGHYSFKYDSSFNTLRIQDGAGSGITVSATGITFPDSTTLTTAPFADAPSNGNYYVRKDGAWHQCQIANVYDNTTMSNVNVLRV